MAKKNTDRPNKNIKVAVICILFVVAAISVSAGLWLRLKKEKASTAENLPLKAGVVVKPVNMPDNIINYNKLEKDTKLKSLMRERKAKYGIEKGLDIIAKSDESFKIGDSTVAMQEIIEKVRLKEGDIIEKDIPQPGEVLTAGDTAIAKATADAEEATYGIYVVQPFDNIWNIHYEFLKDYFEHKGISISTMSDEPDELGFSSGVGKILKFSENMVYIYNLTERKLDVDINLIFPLSKIIVYNMDRVFKLLAQIDYNNVNHIRFDGETIWIPASQLGTGTK